MCHSRCSFLYALTPDYTQARRGDWGGQPLTDVLRGIAYVLDRFPIDADRLVGMSYGAWGGWTLHWLQVGRSLRDGAERRATRICLKASLCIMG